MSRRLAIAAFLTLAAESAACADTPVDWRAAAIGDVTAARSEMLVNSPGGAPGVDPDFRSKIDLAYSAAMSDAQKVTNLEGYHFALERFANGFQDDHVWIDFEDALPRRWPGFLLGYRTGRFRIASTSDSHAYPEGAVLFGCDGLYARAMAERSLTPYGGRWTVPSARRALAPDLLIDRGNPFIARPRRCTFGYGTKTWTRTLDWRPIEAADYYARLKISQDQAPQSQGGVKAARDGGYWVVIPTLNALNPDAIAGLESLMKEIEAKAPAIRSAPYFIIDLRGDSGGNTFVALRVLNAIWGEGTVSSVRPRDLRAEWRVSKDNIAYLSNVQPVLLRLFGKDSLAYAGLSRILAGFRAAESKGEPIFVDPDEYGILAPGEAGPRYEVRGQPFLLTDGTCVSSCLNLVDLALKLPGMVQIGGETGADTFQLENRPAPLPSGHAALEFPIKLYRNRERGLNQSYTPRHVWTGAMADSGAIEVWVAGLARRSENTGPGAKVKP